MSFALLLYVFGLSFCYNNFYVLFCFCGRFILSSFKLCCFMLVVLRSNKKKQKTTLISSPIFRFMTPHFRANPPGVYFKNKDNALDWYRNIEQKHSVSPYLDLYGFHRTLKVHPHRKRSVVIREVNCSRVNWNYSNIIYLYIYILKNK